jgi:hypothetical protein
MNFWEKNFSGRMVLVSAGRHISHSAGRFDGERIVIDSQAAREALAIIGLCLDYLRREFETQQARAA